ncbi:hypothetical protein [Rhodoplanes sp. Z2-YC6860]|uniref:hypothetical protein n=1 Tax=Rhodoplanes sp. Z2-YC6860 TaxID=674703 RepID=UPI0012ED9793|nr:hypothetical protein [Rhodoplanes sp. Z2-YC6860]
MTYTRGKMLRDTIAFALRGIKLHMGKRFVPLKLTEEQRYKIGDEVVRKLKDQWKLDEDMPENLPGPRI